jgi:hypothetical protein
MIQSGQAAKAIKKKTDAMPKVGAKKLLKDAALTAVMFAGPGKFLKAGKIINKAAQIINKDAKVVSATKKSAAIKKKMDAVDAADAKALQNVAAQVKAGINKAEASGKYKKTTVGPRKPLAKSEPAKPTRAQTLKADRKRDLKAEKYKGSLSKERKPLSKEPRLSNDTKKLLEKFQTPKIEPPATRTSLGGMIGESRPLAKGQRRQAAAEEFKTRPIIKRKSNPEDIKTARIEAARAVKVARIKRIQSLRKPVKPAKSKTKQKLTKNNKTGKYDKAADEQDLTGTRDIQTVRGKAYPEGRTLQPSRSGKTIESRTSQNPENRGNKVKAIDEKFKDKQSGKAATDRDVEARVNEGMKTYFPKTNPNKRLPRKTVEDRLIQLKRQARSKRAEQNKREAKSAVTRAKLTPAQKLRVKKAVRETVENSKKSKQSQIKPNFSRNVTTRKSSNTKSNRPIKK